MASNPENPLVQAEKENLKFGGLTAALGLAAIVGSLAIPSHNKQLENLQRGLDVAGIVMVLKGAIQTLEAINRSDELATTNNEESEDEFL